MADESNPLRLTADASQGVAEFERFAKVGEASLNSLDAATEGVNAALAKAAAQTEAFSQAVEKGSASSEDLGKAAVESMVGITDAIAKLGEAGGEMSSTAANEMLRIAEQAEATTVHFQDLRDAGLLVADGIVAGASEAVPALKNIGNAASDAALDVSDLTVAAAATSKDLGSAFAKASKSVKDFQDNADQLRGARFAVAAASDVEKLRKEIERLKDEGSPTEELEAGLERLDAQIEESTEKFGEFKNQQAEMAGKIRAATSEARNFEGGQRDLIETLKVQIPLLGKIVGGVAIATATYKQFYNGTREVIDGLKQFGIDIDAVTKTMFQMEEGGKNLQKALDWFSGYSHTSADDAQELINLNNILSKKYGETAASLDEARKKLEAHSKAAFEAVAVSINLATAHRESGKALADQAQGYATLAAEQRKSGDVEKYVLEGIKTTIDAYEARGEKAPAAILAEAAALGVLSTKQKEVADAAKAAAAGFEGDIVAINKKTAAILSGIEIAQKDGIVTAEAADAIKKAIAEQLDAYKKYGVEAPKELLRAQEAFADLGTVAAASGDKIKKSFEDAKKAAEDAGNKIDAIIKKINSQPSVDIFGKATGGEKSKEIEDMQKRLKALRDQPTQSADQVAEMAALEDSIYRATVAMRDQAAGAEDLNGLLDELAVARDEAAKADAALAAATAPTTAALQSQATGVAASTEATTASTAATTAATPAAAAYAASTADVGAAHATATAEVAAFAKAVTESTVATAAATDAVPGLAQGIAEMEAVGLNAGKGISSIQEAFDAMGASSTAAAPLVTEVADSIVHVKDVTGEAGVSIKSLGDLIVSTGEVNMEMFQQQAAAAGSMAAAIQEGIRLQEEYTVTASESAQRVADTRRDAAFEAQQYLDDMLAPGITEPDKGFEFGQAAPPPPPPDNSSLISNVNDGSAVALDSVSGTFEVLGGISQEFQAQVESGAAVVLEQGSNVAAVVADNTAAGLSTSTEAVQESMTQMTDTVTAGYEGIGQAAARIAQEAADSFVGPPEAAAAAAADMSQAFGMVGTNVSDLGGVMVDSFADGSFAMQNLGSEASSTTSELAQTTSAMSDYSDTAQGAAGALSDIASAAGSVGDETKKGADKAKEGLAGLLEGAAEAKPLLVEIRDLLQEIVTLGSQADL